MRYGRAILRDVEGYVPGEQPRGSGIVKLNTNENPYPPSPKVLDALRNLDVDACRKYPDPVSVKLREACAARYGYPGAEWVMVGNGMDELLAMAIRAFVDPGEAVVSVYPTYTLYETLARLHGAEYETFDLEQGGALPEGLFGARAQICFLPCPNAPTGVPVRRAEIERLCADFDGIVVIDEAYADFAGENFMAIPRDFDNAIVMRTFSKAFSLAGMRLGTAVAKPEIIAEFLKTKDSYNLNAATQAAGVAAMDDYAYMQANVAKICATRSRMTEGLRALGFEVPESETNFVLAQWTGEPGARDIFEALRARNVLVRYFDARGLQDKLRISVGTEEETDALLAALTEILGH